MVSRTFLSRRRLLAGLASGLALVALFGRADDGRSAPTTDDSDGEDETGPDGENGSAAEPPA